MNYHYLQSKDKKFLRSKMIKKQMIGYPEKMFKLKFQMTEEINKIRKMAF